MVNYLFRLLDIDELPIILPFIELLNPKVTLPDLEAMLKELQAQKYLCMGAFFENELVGICGLNISVKFHSGKQIELENFIVKPTFRSQGLGEKMELWIADYAKSIGCKTIELNSYVANSASHKFYFGKGYVILGFHMQKKL